MQRPGKSNAAEPSPAAKKPRAQGANARPSAVGAPRPPLDSKQPAAGPRDTRLCLEARPWNSSSASVRLRPDSFPPPTTPAVITSYVQARTEARSPTEAKIVRAGLLVRAGCKGWLTVVAWTWGGCGRICQLWSGQEPGLATLVRRKD